MKTEPPRSTGRLKKVRLLLWLLVAVGVIGTAALLLIPRATGNAPQAETASSAANFGGPFTLVGADGKPFSSERLAGKPYAMYFGFTRCGDVCPMTLSRLVKLRREAANDQALNIIFVTIDPANDGPREVGQYASLFNAPIIGLTGSKAQIDQVKKQYGIYAEPVPHAPMGQQMMHTSTVLLFDRAARLVATISADEPDSSALQKMKRVTA
jgi:protein SCO1/2